MAMGISYTVLKGEDKMNDGYNAYNESNNQNAGQNSSQNTGNYYYQNYSQNSYQNGSSQNSYQEPPRKKSGVGKVIAITLGMVLLVGIAAIGGSFGTICGMNLFRHKTKHPKFYIGLPMILALQIVLGLVIAVKL